MGFLLSSFLPLLMLGCVCVCICVIHLVRGESFVPSWERGTLSVNKEVNRESSIERERESQLSNLFPFFFPLNQKRKVEVRRRRSETFALSLDPSSSTTHTKRERESKTQGNEDEDVDVLTHCSLFLSFSLRSSSCTATLQAG